MESSQCITRDSQEEATAHSAARHHRINPRSEVLQGSDLPITDEVIESENHNKEDSLQPSTYLSIQDSLI